MLRFAIPKPTDKDQRLKDGSGSITPYTANAKPYRWAIRLGDVAVQLDNGHALGVGDGFRIRPLPTGHIVVNSYSGRNRRSQIVCVGDQC